MLTMNLGFKRRSDRLSISSGEFGMDENKESEVRRKRSSRGHDSENGRLTRRSRTRHHKSYNMRTSSASVDSPLSSSNSVSSRNSSCSSERVCPLYFPRSGHTRRKRESQQQRRRYTQSRGYSSSDDDYWCELSTDEEKNAPRSKPRSRKQSKQIKRSRMRRTPSGKSWDEYFLKIDGFGFSRMNGLYRMKSCTKNHRRCFEEGSGFLLWYHAESRSWVITKHSFEYKYFYAYSPDTARVPEEIAMDWYLRRSMNDQHPERQTEVTIIEIKQNSTSGFLEVGSVVSSKYRDGQYHNALVVGVNRNGTYRLQYLDDGLEVKSQSVANIKPEVYFKKGDRVQAQFRGVWHEVRIIDGSRGAKDGTYQVEWLDCGEYQQPKLPKRISAGRLRCLRSSMTSLNFEGMMVRVESLAMALKDKGVDVSTCKEGVEDCISTFKKMKEDSIRYEEQLEMKLEKCSAHSIDFDKRGIDNDRSVQVREKKLRDIDIKLEEESRLKRETEEKIKALKKQLEIHCRKIDDLQDLRKREANFLNDVRIIKGEVRQELQELEAEKLSLSRTLEYQRDQIQQVEKVLNDVQEKVNVQFNAWCETWASWTSDELKLWILTIGNGHFNPWRLQIEKKIGELQLDGVRLGKVNDLVLKQFGLPDDDVRYLLEEITDLTSGQAGAPKSERRNSSCIVDGVRRKSGTPSSDDSSTSDDLLCVICLNGLKTHICVPCGHKCCCVNCIDKIGKECPMCRKTVQMCIKIFD